MDWILDMEEMIVTTVNVTEQSVASRVERGTPTVQTELGRAARNVVEFPASSSGAFPSTG